MQRSGLVVLGWAAATLVAVGIAYGGVSAVAGRVVDPLPPTLGLQTVAERTDVTVGASPGAQTPSPTDTASASPMPAPSATPSAPASTPDPPPPPASPGADATVAPTESPAGETRSYTLVGGTATLRFEPGRVTVVAAEPAQGFRLDVEGNGTGELRVEFDSDAHRSRLRGWWEGAARDRIEEDVRDGDPDEDGDD